MNPSLRNKLSAKEWNELEKYVKFFTFKVSQVVVQARFGKRNSPSKNQLQVHDWFNLPIEDNPDIQVKAKEAYKNIAPLKDFCICTEILLKTSDGDTLVLETWTVTMNTTDYSLDSPYISYTSLASVYCRMTLLLKSIVSVTRVTPAYKLASRQSSDTFVILFRIYSGEPQVHQLGENSIRTKIGQILTPVGTLHVLMSYRSKDNMAITPQKVEKGNPLVLKSDYFKPVRNSKMLLSDQCKLENKSACQNTSNDLRRMGAFALPGNLPDTFPELDLLEKPFLNLSRSKLNPPINKLKKDDIQKSPDKNANLNKFVNKGASNQVDYNCNPSEENCQKFGNNDTVNTEDLFLLEVKPPFADCDAKNDIGTFFRECQSAPPLASFAAQPTLEEQVTDITSQLMKFETCMNDFDNFVDSICHLNLVK